MLRKLFKIGTAIVLTGCLIEGNTTRSFAATFESQTDKSNYTTQIAQARKYRVRLGDTLGGIARKFGINFNRMLNYNPQLRSRPHLIYIGETINLGSNDRVAPPSSPNSGRIYTVRAGDTLGGIALRHGLSLRTIIQYNPQLASRIDLINVGEKIKVGSAPITPRASRESRRAVNFFNTTNERREGSDNIGSKRGPDKACTKAEKMMKAIAPSNGFQSTFEDYPYFFWYFPGIESEGIPIEFKLTKSNGKTAYRNNNLTLNQAGIIAFPLPLESEPLQEEQEYVWRIRVICTDYTSVDLQYSIKRKSTDNPELMGRLENATVDRYPEILAQSEAWFDALKIIALQLKQVPEDPILTESWNNALRQIEAEELIGETIIYMGSAE